MSRILAIDYGLKRIGLAVTDPNRIIATNLTTVANKDIFVFLDNYVTKEIVAEIVVGYPKHLNNTDNEIVTKIDEFIVKLKNKYPKIQTATYDERYTSKLAAFAMVEAGFRKKTRQDKANLDKMSATILLQGYMEYKKKFNLK